MTVVTESGLQASIADLAIAGIKRIYTSRDLPVELYHRDLPALLPDPTRPLEQVTSTRLTLGGAAWLRKWTLNYVCLVAEIGAGRAPRDAALQVSLLMERVQAALCDWTPKGPHTLDTVRVYDEGTLSDAVSAAIDPARARQFRGFAVQVSVTSTY